MGTTRVGTDVPDAAGAREGSASIPGAHHYRIHNWDDEDGALALDSCRAYGDIAPGIGHALHMPGHIYAGVGMFHESAISLDSATRAEIAYMGRQMVFPYNTWNYAHNRNYLSYVQEQLGLPTEAIRGARELLAVPLDPKLNVATRMSPHWQGVTALSRGAHQVRAVGRDPQGRRHPVGRLAARPARSPLRGSMAHIGKKTVEAATKAVDEHAALKARASRRTAIATLKRQFEVQDLELRGLLGAAEGEGDRRRHAADAGGAQGARTARVLRRSAILPDADVVAAGLRVSRSEESEARRRSVHACAQGGAERRVRARRSGARASRAGREQGSGRRLGPARVRVE